MYFLKFGGKKTLSGTRGVLTECPGWSPGVGALGARPTRRVPGRGLSARPRGTRGGLGSIRGSSRRECPRDTRRTRRAPGCGLRVRHSGTGGVLGDIRRNFPEGAFGDMRHVSKGAFRLNVRDAWRVSKEGPKGL